MDLSAASTWRRAGVADGSPRSTATEVTYQGREMLPTSSKLAHLFVLDSQQLPDLDTDFLIPFSARGDASSTPDGCLTRKPRGRFPSKRPEMLFELR